LSTTAVVAGLKADPVNLLDGGPNGASALNKATPKAVHRVRMKSSRSFTPSFLYIDAAMRDYILVQPQDRERPR
jgi:hypothetical protein